MLKLLAINTIFVFGTAIGFDNSYSDDNIASSTNVIDTTCFVKNIDRAKIVCKKCWSTPEKASDKSCSSCYRYLLSHIKSCSPCTIEQYLDNGMPPDLIIDSFGYSALMHCAEKGFSRCVELLIEAGANTEIQTKKGSTAIMFAASYGHAEVLKTLIENNATIDTQTNSGYTAMSYAAINGKMGVCQNHFFKRLQLLHSF